MKEIKYRIDHAQKIVEQIATQLGGSLNDGYFISDNGNFESKIVIAQVNKNLSCMVSEFRSKDLLRVRRLAAERNDLLILDFHVSDKATLTLNKDKRIKNLIFGAYFASDQIDSHADFGNNQLNKQIALILNREWVMAAFENYPRLIKFLETNADFFVYHSIGLRVANEIYDLHKYSFRSSSSKIDSNYVIGQSLKILSLFFYSLKEEQKYLTQSPNLNHIQELLDCKEHIDNNFLNKITIKALVEKTSMSESKFRKQFKITFETSPYDYIRRLRLWYAKELIEKGESPSQAAYKIGYNNLSYFTKSFKKSFGLVPSSYRRIVLDQISKS